MKTIIILVVVSLISLSYTPNKHAKIGSNSLEAVYNGLTENMDFMFTDDKEKVFLFQEFEEGVSYDLYDEQYIGQKFKVSWEKRDFEETDDEGEPTGNITKINVILELELIE